MYFQSGISAPIIENSSGRLSGLLTILFGASSSAIVSIINSINGSIGTLTALPNGLVDRLIELFKGNAQTTNTTL